MLCNIDSLSQGWIFHILILPNGLDSLQVNYVRVWKMSADQLWTIASYLHFYLYSTAQSNDYKKKKKDKQNIVPLWNAYKFRLKTIALTKEASLAVG